MKDLSSFAAILRSRARRHPDGEACTYLDDRGRPGTLSYADLDRQACRIALALSRCARTNGSGHQGRKHPAGERALLLYPPGLDYVAAFFGCLYAGVIGVPAYPPLSEQQTPRLAAIAADADPSMILTDTALLEPCRAILGSTLRPRRPGPAWMATDALTDGCGDDWRPAGIGPETTAFLQYTSGSTGRPKGVVVSHRNLLHNSAFIQERFGLGPASRGVIWLPPYHDMGLIGGILQPIYGGFPVTLMSPMGFLRDPLRWLEAITRYRATTSGGPNFAYDLCVRKTTPEQRAGLDLSSWTVAFTGAEPVRAATLGRFAAAFAIAGFRPEAFFPCYGLAEATLMVTGGWHGRPVAVGEFAVGGLETGEARPARDGEQRRQLVACGDCAPGQRLAIVDPDTGAECPPGRIGEIRVSGPSVANGYWSDPDGTEHTFAPLTCAEPGAAPGAIYLRTGDLGFLHDGQLYVAGRIKDLIVIRGRNHAPEDIELTAASSDPRLRPGGAAAFSVDTDGAETLAIAHEIHPDAGQPTVVIGDVAAAIRAAVAREHGLAVQIVALLRRGSLPKTSSGKIQRQECRRAFAAGTLPVLAVSTLPTPDEQAVDTSAELVDALTRAAARVLAVPVTDLDPRSPLATWGLDSLKATELCAAFERETAMRLPLDQLLAGAGLGRLARLATAAPPDVEAGPTADDLDGAMTEAERAMWFLHQLDPSSTAYHIHHAVDVTGDLDTGALARSLAALVARHPSLRTRFAVHRGEPRRVVGDASLRWESVVAAGWDHERLQMDIEQFGAQPFDLAAGPLWRFRHYQLAPDRHVLAMAVHHIVADLWSLAILIRELLAAYLDPSSVAVLPPDPGMDTVVRLERAHIASDQGQRTTRMWTRRLGDLPPALDLPTDRPRPAQQTYRGAQHLLDIRADDARAIAKLAVDLLVSPYTVALASYVWLLHRYTGANDLVVGVPAAGRLAPSSHDVVGLLVNTVPVGCHVSAGDTFADTVRHVGERLHEALAAQRMPFPRIVELLQPARDPGRTPIFQTIFVLQQDSRSSPLASFALGAGTLTAGNLTLTPRPARVFGAQFDLTAEIAADPAGGLRVRVLYNADLWDADTVARLAGHWMSLLRRGVAAPSSRLLDLPLLSAAERRLVLVDWNAQDHQPPRDLLHERAARFAQTCPDAPAVADPRATLTYAELGARAGDLAGRLRSAGAGPETRVALLLDRSIEFIVGVLGILQAGAAYVPLDPAHPSARLSYLMRDTRAGLVVTAPSQYAELLDRLRAEHDGPPPFLTLDVGGAARAPAAGRAAQGNGAGPANVAYVMYTSGSTGHPKGVCATHAGVMNLLADMARRQRLRPADVCSWWTSGGFDVSVYEIFSALGAGATLLVVPPEVRPDPHRFADWLAGHAVTSAYVPPFALAALADRAEAADQAVPSERPPLALRRLVVSVEPIPEPTLRRLLTAIPGLQIINGYGPTETTIFSTLHEVDRGASNAGTTPIGRAVQNGPVLLLDPSLRPVPVGVPGELCIGGAGLARGYHARAAATAERFMPNPYAAQPGARMYRTGDIARYLPDGRLRFLGRRDHQLKLRGVRIELGEIESVLARHPAVSSALAMVRSIGGQQALAGYVVTRPGADHDGLGTELVHYLRQQLPAALVPAAVVPLAAWPVTVNGKLDRHALPDPEIVTTVWYEPPRTACELAIAGVWSQLLDGHRVGRDDDFFALGGHSLLAARAALLIGELLDTDVPVVLLLRHPTVAQLGSALDDLAQVSARTAAITVLPRVGADLDGLIAEVEALPPEIVARMLGRIR
jgi:amino acid adenylation domain-containing protein